MASILPLIALLSVLTVGLSADPTNYQYYTAGGIKSGLSTNGDEFHLNGKPIRLFSGSLHYFRLPHQYWSDRLKKFRAGGLNAVQTYVPWNLHEEKEGHFDFETGFLNLKQFLKEAKDADLFVMIRIGPYICAEWEMGGYPSWFLKDRNIRFRSTYRPYLEKVKIYFNKVLDEIKEFQFTKGGPILALQFENEYGGINNQQDKEYFDFMKDVIDKSGFKELLFNCDNNPAPSASKKTQPGVLETINFNSNSLNQLKALKQAQPHKPLYVSEFWPGWFDFWGDKNHHTMHLDHFEHEVNDVIFNANSSINFYMYFGGTNFAFTNGASSNHGPWVTTSYDYNAPLSENGNYTDKYWKAREMFAKFIEQRKFPKTYVPEPPKLPPNGNYGQMKIIDYLNIDDLLQHIKPIETNDPKNMEEYNQAFGFINYRVETPKFKNLKIKGGVADRGVVLIDGFEADIAGNKDYSFNPKDYQFHENNPHVLDILVENMGRPNGGGDMNSARKGINGEIEIDGKRPSKVSVYPMEFKEKFIQDLWSVKGKGVFEVKGRALFRGQLTMKDKPLDTFLRLDGWTKGNVFVNGFNIGRYSKDGPQKTLYVPAPLLKTGANHIDIFELHEGVTHVTFVDKPDLGRE